MAEQTPEGPFMNEDGEWWVPVDQATRDVAEGLVLPLIGEPDVRLTYLGIETVPCHADDHYHWDDAQCTAAGCWPAVECHHFEEDWP